ncbi:MAG: aspartate-semialdehyde dehydrogenase, partial [Fervidobacterium sp.]
RIGHSESVVARTLFPIMSKEDLIETIESSEDVILHEDIITPIEVEKDDYVHVSRVRLFDAHTFGIWVVADNLRIGAATNAVRILEKHLQLNNSIVPSNR